MTPIEVIATAIHAAECGCGVPEQPAKQAAEVVAEALTDPAIVGSAVQALRDAGWGHDHIHGVRLLDDAQLDAIARIVLRSVGGQ